MSHNTPVHSSPPFSSLALSGGGTRVAPTEYDKAVVCSHDRLRRQRERQARQLPLLYAHIEALQAAVINLKQELVVACQQRDIYQQEACALRCRVGLRDHPERVTTAANAAATEGLLREEVTRLRQRVHRLEREKVQCLRQSEAACEAAEHYQELARHAAAAAGCCPSVQLHSSAAGHPPPEGHAQHAWAGGCARGPMAFDTAETNVDIDELRRLQLALDEEQAHRQLIEERVKTLEAALVRAQTRQPSALPLAVSEATKAIDAMDSNHRSSISSSGAASLHTSVAAACELGAGTGEAVRQQRLTEVLRSQNRMLTRRVEELARRNVAYAKEVAALKLARSQLRGRESPSQAWE